MDASKPKFDHGIDVIKGAGERQLLDRLRKDPPKRVLGMYAIGDMHYCWIDRGPEKAKKEPEKKGEEKVSNPEGQPEGQQEQGMSQAQQQN